jgi:Holliday junction resolvase RusA-like endonuclease
MAVHLEFVVIGTPVSNQSTNPLNLTAWKATVKGEAQKVWTSAPLTGRLKAIIINFHRGEKPPLDVDNMSKPIHDAMNKLVYEDDRQIRQAEISHVRIDAPFSIVGVSQILVDAVRAGNEFVYVRIEDPVDPFPLPK